MSRPVVFVHGLWLHASSWRAWAERFSQEVDTANSERGPLLLIGGGKDHTVPTAVTRSTLKQYKGSGAVTDLVEFADRGHSLTVDHGGGALADTAPSWMDKNGLGPR
jgi:pimeloyl-ACP methyl ester carboxylesterase